MPCLKTSKQSQQNYVVQAKEIQQHNTTVTENIKRVVSTFIYNTCIQFLLSCLKLFWNCFVSAQFRRAESLKRYFLE